MLSQVEMSEWIGLHGAVYHVECFGAGDVLREAMLFSKATRDQIRGVYVLCGCWVKYDQELIGTK